MKKHRVVNVLRMVAWVGFIVTMAGSVYYMYNSYVVDLVDSDDIDLVEGENTVIDSLGDVLNTDNLDKFFKIGLDE